MDCSTEQLNAWVDGELSDVEAAAVREHVQGCPVCQRELDALSELAGDLDRTFEEDRFVVQQTRLRLRHRARRPRIVAQLAAAALLALCVGGAMLLGPRGPESAIVSVCGGTRTGETIETSPGETADVTIRGGASATLSENTRLDVLAVSGAGPLAEASLRQGKVRVFVPKVGGGRPAFLVSTPVGSVKTLGTEFEVALASIDKEGDQTMSNEWAGRTAPMLLLVTVLSGQVLVQSAAGEEVVAPEAGRLTGQVVGYHRAKGRLSVKVEGTSAGHEELKGKTVEFITKWTKNADGKWVRDPANMKLLFSAITGDKVEIGFHFAEHYRVDTLEFVSKVPRQGRLVGEVVAREKNLLHVKVTGTAAGAEMLKGLTLVFCPEWSKNEAGRWRPDPTHVERLAKAKVGDTVEIGYYVNEHYRANSVEVQGAK